MTYKTTARQAHFRAQEGSSSVRITQRGYGGASLPGDPIRILPTLREQFDVICARMEELQVLIKNAPDAETAERLRRELAGKTSQHGNMRKTLYKGCMQAMERVFVDVARARLPEDLFWEIMEEARGHYAASGLKDFEPKPNKTELRSINKKIGYHNWRKGL